MIKMLFWVFAAYGMSTIIVYGSIFEGTRNWIRSKSTFFGQLISCMLCTSTWVGFFLSIFLLSLTDHYFRTKLTWLGVDITFVRNLLLDGTFTAGSVWALNSIIEWFEKNIPQDRN